MNQSVVIERTNVTLSSFGAGLNVAVIGASGGIGGALTRLLAGAEQVADVQALSRHPLRLSLPHVRDRHIDITDEASVRAAADRVRVECGELDLVIVASGVLQEGDTVRPEKSWRTLDAETMRHVLEVNTIGPALIAKHFLALLPRDRRAVFAAISARVGSISDNRLGGWYSYRASKAALNMILKTASIELQRKNPQAVCIGLHPGTVNTRLSKPFQSGVPSDKLFPPLVAARHLLSAIDTAGPERSGAVIDWAGEIVPP